MIACSSTRNTFVFFCSRHVTETLKSRPLSASLAQRSVLSAVAPHLSKAMVPSSKWHNFVFILISALVPTNQKRRNHKIICDCAVFSTDEVKRVKHNYPSILYADLATNSTASNKKASSLLKILFLLRLSQKCFYRDLFLFISDLFTAKRP